MAGRRSARSKGPPAGGDGADRGGSDGAGPSKEEKPQAPTPLKLKVKLTLPSPTKAAEPTVPNPSAEASTASESTKSVESESEYEEDTMYMDDATKTHFAEICSEVASVLRSSIDDFLPLSSDVFFS